MCWPRSPTIPETTFRLARVLAEQGKTLEAAEAFSKTVVLEPKMQDRVVRERRRYAEGFQREAETHLEADRTAEADTALTRAEILLPEDGETAYLRGRLARETGDLEGAVPLFRSALDSDPENREYRETLAGALLAFGKERYEDGDFETAYALLNEADTLRSSLDLQYLRGMTAYAWAQQTEEEIERLDRLAVAAECFQRVLEKDPKDADARFNLGAVLLASERYAEAADVYHDLIRETPQDGRLFSALSRAHSLIGMNAAAPHRGRHRALAPDRRTRG